MDPPGSIKWIYHVDPAGSVDPTLGERIIKRYQVIAIGNFFLIFFSSLGRFLEELALLKMTQVTYEIVRNNYYIIFTQITLLLSITLGSTNLLKVKLISLMFFIFSFLSFNLFRTDAVKQNKTTTHVSG